MYKTIVKIPATVEPISIDEARDQLRVDVGFDEDHIKSLISIARDRAEKYCNRFFTVQTVSVVYDCEFSGSSIELPFPDLQSLSSIKTYDDLGVETVINPASYSYNSALQKVYFSDVPTGYSTIVFEVVTAPPAELGGAKIGMLMYLTDLYELRAESVVGSSVAMNPAVVNSLYPYRVNIGV